MEEVQAEAQEGMNEVSCKAQNKKKEKQEATALVEQKKCASSIGIDSACAGRRSDPRCAQTLG